MKHLLLAAALVMSFESAGFAKVQKSESVFSSPSSFIGEEEACPFKATAKGNPKHYGYGKHSGKRTLHKGEVADHIVPAKK